MRDDSRRATDGAEGIHKSTNALDANNHFIERFRVPLQEQSIQLWKSVRVEADLSHPKFFLIALLLNILCILNACMHVRQSLRKCTYYLNSFSLLVRKDLTYYFFSKTITVENYILVTGEPVH